MLKGIDDVGWLDAQKDLFLLQPQVDMEPYGSHPTDCFLNSIHVWLAYKEQQQSDETPMVWEMLLYMYILHSPDWHYRSTMPTFLFLYGAVFAAVHSVVRFGIGFKVHYAILCLLCIPRMYKYYIYTQDVSAKRLAKMYVATLLVGTLCWLFDRNFCQEISSWPINPQGHALWHVFMGFNSYFANTFLMFCRAQQRGWSPKVVHFMGVLPFVKIEKPKAQ
ncbi:ALKALINE CERAMIDASE [Salix purpurea]|uniref:ALKALINE CERAMIDASE n=1 Tax=Salix purpurea TaxID=77065 RepID=A0A9Q0WZL3_SALPP|nr:ALKALINE CERAMIDASE [Salix purpurea]